MRNKILSLLALLLTAVTGAWATDGVLLTTITAADNSSFKSGSQTFGDVATVTLTGDYLINDGSHGGWYCQGSNKTATISVAAANGANITSVKFYTAGGGSAEDKDAPFEVTTTTVTSSNITTYLNGNSIGSYGVSKIEVYGAAEPPIEVTPVAEPAANTKQWTFTQPGSDVVLTPQYAPTATWATTGSGSEVKTLLPEAAEGVIAGTDAPLIAEGTVANAGTTENPQGLVMYYAAKGTADAAPTAPTLESQWSADVPTAEAYINDEDGATVYVWYYIAGANTPDGEDPTADNTFSDSEICAEPLKVTLLTNKFDLTLNAANANTIEDGNATVTVGGTAATVTDGKLQGVKMGSEVKMTAKQGYKFRKVEVKKGGAATLATALENGATVVIAFKYRDDGTCTFTNNNGTFTFVSGTGQLGGGNGPKQLSVETGKLIFKGSGTNSFTDRWSWYGFQVTFDPTANTYEVWKGSYLDVASFTSISVNGTDITDQLSELK